MKKLLLITIVMLICLEGSLFSQVSTAIREQKKDSVVPLNYPYILPILGEKVAKKGFQLPFPFGVMINTFFGNQNLSMSDLKVGFNHNEMINLDSIIHFKSVSAKAITVNTRIDGWIMPFWDLYVLGGYGNANMDVIIDKPFDLTTNTESQGYYFGVGSTLAFGIRHFFASMDGSYVWNYQNLLDKPAQVLTVGVRTGPVFNFPKHKEMNLVIWCGGLFTNLNSETVGNIQFTEVFPDAEQSVQDLQDQLDTWYNGLTPPKQNLYEDVYNKLSDGLSNVSENISTSSIQYQMKKKIDKPFNLIIGGQYQYSLRWQLRGEAQILGDRFGGLVSLNYRFGIKGKNMLSGN
jgi:hypothetical protein